MDIKNILFKITHPEFWINNGHYCKDTDKIVNSLIDSGLKIELDDYIAKISGVKLWLSNYPYHFGFLHGVADGQPFPLTQLRLKKRIDAIRSDLASQKIRRVFEKLKENNN